MKNPHVTLTHGFLSSAKGTAACFRSFFTGNITGMKLHIDLPEFFFSVYVSLVHFHKATAASVTGCFYIFKRICSRSSLVVSLMR